MNHMKFETPDLTAQNIEKLAALFPGCVTEGPDGHGGLKKAVNFDLLKQMLSDAVLEGDEAYEFTWVGKKAAIVEANKPIRKTLRPCPEESKNWDTTENLYIEGDNLEVLKLLQEAYLGKVKMIYIDPPYNTGHDFIYNDRFEMDKQEYNQQIGLFDEEGNKNFVENPASNPRFHSDWCSMMYPRLMLARNILSDDGFIFVSIDEHEIDDMLKLCKEAFGEANLRNIIAVRRGIKNVQAQFETLSSLAQGHEYILLFSKTSDSRLPKLYSIFDQKKAGKWDTFWRGTDRPTMRYELFGTLPDRGQWRWEKSRADRAIQNYQEYTDFYACEMSIDEYYSHILSSTGIKPDFLRLNDEGKIQYYVPPQEGKLLSDNWMDIMMSGNYTVFDTEKSLDIMERIVRWIVKENDIIFDFFSGSATTAHAVMQLNAEDSGHRKFIMVQLPEPCNEKSEAYKAGYKNICEIGKERIRRAGEKIKEESPLTTQNLDIGFRVLKLDTTNMEDVYYSAQEYSQQMLQNMASNIKSDRTDLDLLFGCLLDWGLPLSMPYHSEQMEGCTVHTYNDGDLIACFDENVPESVIREIARRKPLRAVFRDSSFATSPEKINVGEIFKLLAPDTRVKVI